MSQGGGWPNSDLGSIPRRALPHPVQVGKPVRWLAAALGFPEHLAQALHHLVVGVVQRAAAGGQQLHGLADAAGLVDQVAKGAKPAELPIIPSSRFHLAVNLRTARLFGITLPVALIARADEVIE